MEEAKKEAEVLQNKNPVNDMRSSVSIPGVQDEAGLDVLTIPHIHDLEVLSTF